MSRSAHPFLATPEEIIDEARNGRMFILVDDEDRENEGDLVIASQMATPTAVNFMATHGRGLICLALTRERAEQLGLKPMSQRNGTRHETAFTISIEARIGVTTGISAQDRARTISVAIDAANGPAEIVSPGHVFPLVARDGGVLVRAGHTEAAVDVARLAGLNPSGVICEIMKDDGSMARLDDLVAFAQKHGLKLGTIRDLIAYRGRHDHLVERIEESSFVSEHGGEWKTFSYRNTIEGIENLVLQMGDVGADVPTLVRVHTVCPFSDLLGGPGPRKRLLQRAMDAIASAGGGIIVLLGPRAGELRATSIDSDGEMDLRSYGLGAQILADLGVRELVLLTNSQLNPVALGGHGLNIVGVQPIPD